MKDKFRVLRSKLKRNYGSTTQHTTLIIRVPLRSIYELLYSTIDNIYEKVRLESFTDILILTDSSYLRLNKDTFLKLVSREKTIEETLRSPEKEIIISEPYKEIIKALLDELVVKTQQGMQLRAGRRTVIISKGRGKTVKYRIPKEPKDVDVALLPSIKAAALRVGTAYKQGSTFTIESEDIRERIRKRTIGASIVIVYDDSSSIEDERKRGAVLAVIRLLLVNAYERRDEVALISYCGKGANVISPLTPNVTALDKYLALSPSGGTTPLASGIYAGIETLSKGYKAPSVPIIVLISDGTTNVPMRIGVDLHRELYSLCRIIRKTQIKMLVLDISEKGSLLAKRLALASEGLYHHLKF
jgi:magnesium chelatase subunit D